MTIRRPDAIARHDTRVTSHMPVARVKLDRVSAVTAKLRCYKNILSTQLWRIEESQKAVQSQAAEVITPSVAERRFYYTGRAVTHLCVLRIFSVPSRRVRLPFTPFTSTCSTPLEYIRNRRVIKEWETQAGGTCGVVLPWTPPCGFACLSVGRARLRKGSVSIIPCRNDRICFTNKLWFTYFAIEIRFVLVVNETIDGRVLLKRDRIQYSHPK